MSYTLSQLAADISETLKADNGPQGKAKVATFVSRALTDKAFIAAELKERAPGANPWGERLGSKGFVELDRTDVRPADPGALERKVGSLDRREAEVLRI